MQTFSRSRSGAWLAAIAASATFLALGDWSRLAKAADAQAPAEIGSRWELLIDRWLVDKTQDVELVLGVPDRREIVLATDKPWEGHTSAYFCVVQDGDRVRLYYRGSAGGNDGAADQVTCMAESRDGIHFTRPELGVVEVDGSTANNVVWKGIESHNFAPFLDTNPDCKPAERYKALAGINAAGSNWREAEVARGLYAFASPDGIHWEKMSRDPTITDGKFDSLNLAFWDPTRNRYACYSRIVDQGVRAIQSLHSSDFLHWSEPVPNRYAEGVPREHFYTNATLPCPGAEHLLLSFPKRFVPSRKKIAEHPDSGVSDAVFLSSRDGTHWDRTFLEAWVRPGRDPRNWTERSNMPAWGIAQTAPGEWSMYISEHYRWPDNRMRRLVIPERRFASAHAGAAGGEFTTRPLVFAGNRLELNYATSAAGGVRVELQDEQGQPLAGFALDDMEPVYGDELAKAVAWKGGADVSKMAGKPVRMRFELRDADVFAFRFHEADGD